MLRFEGIDSEGVRHLTGGTYEQLRSGEAEWVASCGKEVVLIGGCSAVEMPMCDEPLCPECLKLGGEA